MKQTSSSSARKKSVNNRNHPSLTKVNFTCACGASFEAFSSVHKDLIKLDICSKCHPFYTGNSNIVDTAGRVQRYLERQNRVKAAATTVSENN